MKKIIIATFALLVSLSFGSCTNDDIFDVPASERVVALQKETDQILSAAPNGWMMEYFCDSTLVNGGFRIFMKFDGAKGQVTVTSERGGANKTATSYYSYGSDMGASLLFDTFNPYFHVYSEPNPGYGDMGVGYGGDYEFAIIEATPEKVVLRGRKTKLDFVMTPLADGDWSDLYQTYLDEIAAIEDAYISYRVYDETIDDYYTLIRNYPARSFTVINPKGEDAGILGYIHTDSGIKLYRPFKFGNRSVSSFDFDPATKTLVDPVHKMEIKEEKYTADLKIGTITTTTSNAKYEFSSNQTETSYIHGITTAKEFDSFANSSDYLRSKCQRVSESEITKSSKPNEVLTSNESYLKPNTEYVAYIFGAKFSFSADRAYPVSRLEEDKTYKRFTTDADGNPSADYSKWLGQWTVTSTSCTDGKVPVTFDIVVTQGAADSYYLVYGWDLTYFTNDFPMVFDFKAAADGNPSEVVIGSGTKLGEWQTYTITQNMLISLPDLGYDNTIGFGLDQDGNPEPALKATLSADEKSANMVEVINSQSQYVYSVHNVNIFGTLGENFYGLSPLPDYGTVGTLIAPFAMTKTGDDTTPPDSLLDQFETTNGAAAPASPAVAKMMPRMAY